jgi:F-type H+-transporting ATPase subunit epsilon
MSATTSESTTTSASPAGLVASGAGLRCQIVTPERKALDEVVDFVALPLFDGELGVLPGRSPLIGRLGYGELRIRQGQAVRRFFIDGGFAQLRDNVLTILTSQAVAPEKINADLAARDLDAAQARVARTDPDQADKDRALSRARAQVRLAERAR